MKLEKRKLFNAVGDDSLESRMIIGGNPTGIANLNSVRYDWASGLYTLMLNNHWIPQKISLVEDKSTIKELTSDEMDAFKDTLSFLIALDSMQTANIPKLADYVTAPEVSQLFTLQAFQEMIHSQSYQYMLQELFPSTERDAIYNRWRDNPLLLERNQFIADQYELFNQEQSLDNFKIALAGDMALEGIYFYEGFNFFYMLAARNKVARVASMIKYIENDEHTHVSFMVNLIREVFDRSTKDTELLFTTLRTAAEHEIRYGKQVYGNRILGVSEESTEAHVKWLTNQRCKALRIDQCFPGYTKNPYDYLDVRVKGNFFETSVTEYSQSSAVSGWDSF
jgi:ribonucleoside-diphosphate reductase beta chain